MTTAFRILTTILTTIFPPNEDAIAERSIAPAPHVPLEVLVREYKRFDLPIPPPNAELVHVRDGFNSKSQTRFLGFRTPPAQVGQKPQFLFGLGLGVSRIEFEFIPSFRVELAQPDLSAIREVQLQDQETLCLAIQCKLRGWHLLANAIYAKTRESLNGDADDALRKMAWQYWEEQLTKAGTDRARSLRQLRLLVDEEPEFRTDDKLKLVEDLSLTLSPRKSKPGSVEALIDDLTECTEDPNSLSNLVFGELPRNSAYLNLVDLGLEAVPALIAHRNDQRVTRVRFFPRACLGELGDARASTYFRVGDLCQRLLSEISCDVWMLEVFFREVEGDSTKAQKWWAEARRVGEEKWLVDHALPTGGDDEDWEPGNGFSNPNIHIARVLRVKYPRRLPEIYRTITQMKPNLSSGAYAKEILASSLPLGEKCTLFQEVLDGESCLHHRFEALEALGRLNPSAIRKPVFGYLRSLTYGNGAVHPDLPSECQLVTLIELVGSRDAWDALVIASKKVPAKMRRLLTWEVGSRWEPSQNDPHRQDRLRFLLELLDDRTIDLEESKDDRLELRDYAADRLGLLLGLTEWHDPRSGLGNWFNTERGPLSRMILRFAVRQDAEQELKRLGK